MKGHVGGGPVTDNLWVSADRSNSSRSLMRLPLRLAAMERADVLIRKHTSLYICAGTAPGDAGLALAYSSGGSIVHQLESLILAQNERWRHA
jgi:hypothetical protein